mmetsp:Transcript_106214/g.298658  ORF Transcript_106214/g.298658 Transcript_106214/m.298658 type:complete len:123 (-) Transcript_106214:100-468(-)|eukprot:CAMPEP_0117524670 /NCGR_PEP_ID=MMETSP0784-20121206/35371_1 /TAXON_ID=39447 /ORGANISM="" /LENGTH=122 /DNA_ID=CAMNT_0005320837 /DNA_START=96 /DNA_END=464 /DNA_ORIENTATION=+
MAMEPYPDDNAQVTSFPSQYDESGMSSFDRVEIDLRGAPLRLICALSGGGQQEVTCNMGHDVAYAKGELAKKLDVAYGDLQFFLDGQLMFDPLSFNDFPAINNLAEKTVAITVQVAQTAAPQ